LPELVTRKEPVRQTQHAFPQRGYYLLRQRDLSGSVRRHLRRPQYVRSILQQSDKAELGIGTRSATGGGPAKDLFVFRRIGHLQRAAVQSDEPPVALPSPFRLVFRNGSHHCFL
jgi:hypothetical protein